MKETYRSLANTLERSMAQCNGMNVSVEDSFGSSLFPENSNEARTKGKLNQIFFNDKVDVILALYNLAMNRKVDTGRAVVEFVLFQSFMEQENYEQAQKCLAAFESELYDLHLEDTTAEEVEQESGVIAMQVYFLLSHEAAHVIFSNNERSKQAELRQTRDLMHDLKTEMEDLRARYDVKDIVNDPRVQRHIWAVVPESLSAAEKEMIHKRLSRMMQHSPYTPAFVGEMADGNNMAYLEEISADRVAWLTLLNALRQMDATNEDILQMNMSFLVSLAAMEFNKVLQSHYIPSLYGKYEYDGLKVHLRQQIFKTLLRQYTPDVDKLYKHQYSDMIGGLERILQTVNSSIEDKIPELKILYSNAGKDAIPVFATRNRLNAAMDNVLSEYLHL